MGPAEFQGLRIDTAEQAAGLLVPLFAATADEKVAALHLDAERRLLELSEHAGGIDEAELPLRALAADALRCGAAGLVLAHCHPSGDPEPSAADLRATRILAETLARLGIDLHDHIIFGGGAWRSLRAAGLL